MTTGAPWEKVPSIGEGVSLALPTGQPKNESSVGVRKSSRQVSQTACSDGFSGGPGLSTFGHVSAALITPSASLSPATLGSPATQRPNKLDSAPVSIGPNSGGTYPSSKSTAPSIWNR